MNDKPEALRLADAIEKAIRPEASLPLGEWARAAAELRRLDAENESLRQIIADCPPIEAELQEVSDRAHRAEAQRDALLEALRNYVNGCSLSVDALAVARAAIAAVEGEKK